MAKLSHADIEELAGEVWGKAGVLRIAPDGSECAIRHPGGKHVSLWLTVGYLNLGRDEFKSRILKPAVEALRDSVERG